MFLFDFTILIVIYTWVLHTYIIKYIITNWNILDTTYFNILYNNTNIN